MKRQFLLLVLLLAWSMAVPAQETVTVKFTAVNEIGQYSPFTSVVATNETRGWTDTLAYPDTILVLSHTGVVEHAGVGFSIGTAYPNPFTDETKVPLELSEACEVQLRVVHVDGTVLVSCSRYLDAGSHCVTVHLSDAGLAFLTVATPQGSMVSKLIGIGDGGGNTLAVETLSAMALRGEKSGFSRGNAPGEFVPGDMMRYEALLERNGTTLHSEVVTQEQYDSETVTLRFNNGFGHHEYVDLGLPSGLLWATCNVGANSPEDYGDYFAWGETTPKNTYDWSTYQYCNGSSSTLTKYCNKSSYGYNGYTDTLTILLPEDDAATVNWGNDWRMPTKAEWEELCQNTTNTWTIQNGVHGRLFTASNGNTLFLPAAGCRVGEELVFVGDYGDYWSSLLLVDHARNAVHLYFSLDEYIAGSDYRSYGQSVRPVRSPGQSNVPTGAIDGKFTINEDGGQVYFSQGNLQYQASTNTWRFATNQCDYIGADNLNASSTYSGWIDVFGWGTSGWNSGNTYYHPRDSNNSNGSLYGPPGEYNLTGSYANADCGVYNPISNGGNQMNQWRTLTQPEWNYVFQERNTISDIRFVKAKITGTSNGTVNGVVLLPDSWRASTYALNNPNPYGYDSGSYTDNTISLTDWDNVFHTNGAVFLPAAGFRYGTSVDGVGFYGSYWSASYSNSSGAYSVDFDGLSLLTDGWYFRYYGQSVRLVRIAE